METLRSHRIVALRKFRLELQFPDPGEQSQNFVDHPFQLVASHHGHDPAVQSTEFGRFSGSRAFVLLLVVVPEHPIAGHVADVSASRVASLESSEHAPGSQVDQLLFVDQQQVLRLPHSEDVVHKAGYQGQAGAERLHAQDADEGAQEHQVWRRDSQEQDDRQVQE